MISNERSMSPAIVHVKKKVIKKTNGHIQERPIDHKHEFDKSYLVARETPKITLEQSNKEMR